MREDLRNADQLRPISCEVRNVAEASGSAKYVAGNTSAVATVYGPSQCRHAKHENYERGVVEIEFSQIGHGQTGQSNTQMKRERQVMDYIRKSIEGSILLERYPRMMILLRVCVFADDGGALSAAVNACSLALTVSGILMRAIPVSVALVVDGKDESFVLDPSKREEKAAASEHTYTFACREVKSVGDGEIGDRNSQTSLVASICKGVATAGKSIEALEVGELTAISVYGVLRQASAAKLPSPS
jgi:ribonuclease PH